MDNKVHFEPSRAALLVRVMSIMLLTDWGYDVAVFDPDAFILQDPFVMYEKVVQKLGADIIGQKGTFPFDIGRRLGYTLCMGAIFYRGSSDHLSECDEHVLVYGLLHMHSCSRLSHVCIRTREWT